MYISKFLVPAILALTGLAQANAVTGEGALEARAGDILAAGENAAWLDNRDVSEADINLSERQDYRGRCRDNEYYDQDQRRCRRFEVMDRPSCRFGERAYCGRGRSDLVRYGMTPDAGDAMETGSFAPVPAVGIKPVVVVLEGMMVIRTDG
ncbi:hypothetical protein F4861DRAFT_538434 [Xylaria intraflava]|nr:hypothetical protein F4861DRAFT_538434 [Xylaria intraflava]